MQSTRENAYVAVTMPAEVVVGNLKFKAPLGGFGSCAKSIFRDSLMATACSVYFAGCALILVGGLRLIFHQSDFWLNVKCVVLGFGLSCSGTIALKPGLLIDYAPK